MNNVEMLAISIEYLSPQVAVQEANYLTEKLGSELPFSGDHLITRITRKPLFANTTEARLYPDRTTPEARAHEYANKLIAKRRAMNHTRQGINSNSRYYAEHVLGVVSE